MGNSNSSENKRTENYKTYKVTKVEKLENLSWFRLHFDDYVKYGSYGNSKYIDLDRSCFFRLWLGIEGGYFGVGDYVKIDLNITELESNIHTFKSESVCLPVKIDSSLLARDLLEFAKNVGEGIEESQRYTASIEQSRYANNHAWTKQTSWDMPPNWK